MLISFCDMKLEACFIDHHTQSSFPPHPFFFFFFIETNSFLAGSGLAFTTPFIKFIFHSAFLCHSRKSVTSVAVTFYTMIKAQQHLYQVAHSHYTPKEHCQKKTFP